MMQGKRETPVRRVLLIVFRRIIALYFREIEIVGEVPKEGVGGRIFGGNHVNGLVDPILVLTQARINISPIAKSTLWKIPGLRWLLDAGEAVQILRKKDDPNKQASANDAVFERIANHLSTGGNILIFPEGTSHNEPHLLPLRTGAARMLTLAKEHGAKGLTFQSVGLEFEARATFRSRVLVVFGPVRSVDALAEETSLENLPRAITDMMQSDLSDLILEASTWDERLLVVRVAEMFAHHSGDRTLAGWNAVSKRVEAARRAVVPGDPLYEKIVRRVAEYYARLEDAGLRDNDVLDGEGIDSKRILRGAILVLLSPLAALGVVLYFLPYQIPRLVARLAHNDEDVVSTYKLGAGFVVYPLWTTALVVYSLLRLPHPFAFVAALAAILSPFAALAWLDRSANLRASIRALSPTSERDALRAARANVMILLEEARAKLSPLVEPENSKETAAK
jgi:glycerol-3-phosphate O-acyltransferase/dihydroxyacetone phosphate acyltransferase